ncbi:hypothetical protein XELAEV_18010290mg [Xenopus laevis]|uniref:Olfactory receptor n=1 Tax=Xenopus laevis TaxID=8355 RepID=A0A974DUC1_XENLA|nr:hypothetical protein XELAEV_18010290mg [Xenopus laevis]
MLSVNQTTFTLVGFSLGLQMQICMFIVFLGIYLVSVMGNVVILAVTSLRKSLHTPMYFFLCNMAVLDIGFISCTLPKLLTILSSNNKSIAFIGCILQLYFYMCLGSTEFYMLAIMSVDRYVAISYPLRYSTIMTMNVSLLLILLSWVFGFLAFLYPIALLLDLSFCGPFVLNHFFCECSVLVKVSCSDTQTFDMLFSSCASAIVLLSFTITAVSYTNILYTIIRIPSSSGKRKAFSTCASHFIAVNLAYVTVIFLYVRSAKTASPELTKIITILNSILAPLTHPFIYTLRNKQVQDALRVSIKKALESRL